MIVELLGTLLETLLGNIPQLGLVLSLLYGAHLLGKGKLFAMVIDHIRLIIIVLVVGTLSGALELHPGAIMGLFSRLMGLVTGLFG